MEGRRGDNAVALQGASDRERETSLTIKILKKKSFMFQNVIALETQDGLECSTNSGNPAFTVLRSDREKTSKKV